MSVFPNPQAPTQAQPPSYSDKQFLHTHQAGVAVPFTQSAVTAVMMGVFVFAMIAVPAVAFRWRHWLGWAGTLSLFSTLGSMIGMWLYLQRRWLHLTAERILNIEIPDAPERSEQRTVKVQISQVKDNGHYKADMMTLPCSEKQLEELAAGLKNGMKFTERVWAGTGRIFSIDGFKELKSVMLRRGLIIQKNEKDARQGFVLTEAGQALIEQYEPETSENA